MLSGVLVVAFPVSVFSDLWSEELKEVKGFKDLFENDPDDDDKDDKSQIANDKIPSVPRIRLQPNGDDTEYVVLKKTDLNEIVASLRTIGQEQQRIKRLLKKYFVAKED